MGGALGGGGQGDGGMAPVCGDGVVDENEACDDGNGVVADGCADCMIAAGFTCVDEPSVCGAIEQIITGGPGLNVSIVDQADHYDGLLTTMDCTTVVHAGLVGTAIDEVTVSVAIEHDWLGDLILKLVSPEGTIVTLMNRPGAAEPSDAYNENPTGDSSNLVATAPIAFSDSFSDDAETMGSGIDSGERACDSDSRCEYLPSPGTGPGVALADFAGENPVGMWRLCAADGDNGDSGTIDAVALTVRATAPPPR